MIVENAHMQKRAARKSARGGRALLTGLTRCGRCGRMMRVFYGTRSGHAHRYQCRGDDGHVGSGLIPAYDPAEQKEETISVDETAQRLKICVGSVHHLIRQGVLPATQLMPSAPWKCRDKAVLTGGRRVCDEWSGSSCRQRQDPGQIQRAVDSGSPPIVEGPDRHLAPYARAKPNTAPASASRREPGIGQQPVDGRGTHGQHADAVLALEREPAVTLESRQQCRDHRLEPLAANPIRRLP